MPAKHNAKFNLPPELQDWFVQEIDEKGKSAIAASEWWNSECNTKLNSGEWKNKWPSYGSHVSLLNFVRCVVSDDEVLCFLVCPLCVEN